MRGETSDGSDDRWQQKREYRQSHQHDHPFGQRLFEVTGKQILVAVRTLVDVVKYFFFAMRAWQSVVTVIVHRNLSTIELICKQASKKHWLRD
ncbi:hypothetical protein OAK98_00510 [Mariniblastus sp.]|nr:hypothetical protein [Mariniblastus sp.]MDA7910078.1 hypothetical protein [bacterium]MDC0293850.1 hypothetical protein [Mariniblastus sp.]